MADDLTPDEIRQLASLALRAVWAPTTTRAAIQAHGINVVPLDQYSTVPSLRELEETYEDRFPDGPYMDGRAFDETRMMGYFAALEPWMRAFDPPVQAVPGRPEAFTWDNPMFSGADAAAYYAILRLTRPKRVLEVGAGHSTKVASMALEANGEGELIVIDPRPPDWVGRLPRVKTVHRRRIQDLGLDEALAMAGDADVLFIDSTHTVKVGSDCLFLYLQLLPRLKRRILVHSHDIYLPYGFPPHLGRDLHQYWTEQYLLAALLLSSPHAEAVFGSHWMFRRHPVQLRRSVRAPNVEGGSLWYWYGPMAGHEDLEARFSMI